jgi:hypothetical protein
MALEAAAQGAAAIRLVCLPAPYVRYHPACDSRPLRPQPTRGAWALAFRGRRGGGGRMALNSCVVRGIGNFGQVAVAGLRDVDVERSVALRGLRHGRARLQALYCLKGRGAKRCLTGSA